MRPEEKANEYQDFFNFMNQEHDLTLTCEEMDEIVFEAQRLVEKLTIPVAVGQSEQCCECKCEFPIIRTGVTEYCSISQLEVK